ncbi:MAG: hypothetical protein R3217_04970 [Gammaproteobacteria bacterium]|nr:hypothetical protein [Gammaproteobacteria bacterium]
MSARLLPALLLLASTLMLIACPAGQERRSEQRQVEHRWQLDPHSQYFDYLPADLQLARRVDGRSLAEDVCVALGGRLEPTSFNSRTRAIPCLFEERDMRELVVVGQLQALPLMAADNEGS